ncbi:MAG TPA: ABC transporter transmembrane domain-containing protein, partial [Deinococcales bacterium]|nr:ABC transporter transmembrane domain-containing protein [Deinococcales bacterium]
MTAASRGTEALDQEKRDLDLALAWRMVAYLRPYLLVAGAALTAMLGFALLDTQTVNLLKRALDQALAPVGAFRAQSGAERYAHLQAIAALYAVFAAGAFLVRYAQGYLLTLLGQSIVRDIRRDLYRKFIRLPLAYFDRNPVGRLMTRVTSDVDAVNQFLTQGLIGLAQDVFLLGVFGTAMFLYDVPLTLAGFTVLVPLWFVTRWLRARMRAAFRATRLHQALVNIFLNETITGMTTVQLFGRQASARAEFQQRNFRFLGANLESVRWYSIFYPFVGLMGDLGLAVILLAGGLGHLERGLSIGTVVAMVELLRRLFGPLQDIADKFNVLQAAFASAERIYGVLDEPESLQDRPDAVEMGSLRGSVELQNVWFAYTLPGQEVRDEDWVLRDVSLKIQPGESIALVGA